jgi:hypothetical protein
VPVSLHDEQQMPNVRPSFVAELCDPPLGTTISPTVDQPVVAPHIVAEDPNTDDTLTVRVFNVLGAQQPLVFLFGLETQLASTNPLQPEQRSGDLPMASWCPAYFSGQSGSHLLAVVVADRPFQGQTDTAVGGLTSRGSWVLNCP